MYLEEKEERIVRENTQAKERVVVEWLGVDDNNTNNGSNINNINLNYNNNNSNNKQ